MHGFVSSKSESDVVGVVALHVQCWFGQCGQYCLERVVREFWFVEGVVSFGGHGRSHRWGRRRRYGCSCIEAAASSQSEVLLVLLLVFVLVLPFEGLAAIPFAPLSLFRSEDGFGGLGRLFGGGGVDLVGGSVEFEEDRVTELVEPEGARYLAHGHLGVGVGGVVVVVGVGT